MDVLCLDDYSEMLPGDVENSELLIENLVALILLDLFDVVVIDGVNVTCLPMTRTRQTLCVLQVRAVCSIETVNSPVNAPERLEARLENAVCCALIELFSTVSMKAVRVHYEHNAALHFAALPRSA